MTAKIHASTSSGLVIDSDMSGSLALVANGITVATLNGTGANAGIQLGSSMAPCFSAYANAGQTVTAGTFTKIAINTKIFDTNGNFDATTNYRFTPTVAGYYQVNGSGSFGTTGAAELIVAIYKNGSIYSRGTDTNMASGTFGDSVVCYNEIIYMNGSSDYIELYGLVSANPRTGNGLRYYDTWLTSRFSAALVRSA
jgi:hypothetical protein